PSRTIARLRSVIAEKLRAHAGRSGGIEVLAAQPPQANSKKSVHGSTDRSSASGSTPAWTEGPGGRVATRGHTEPQPKAVTRERTAATCFTNGRVRARGAPMFVPGVTVSPRPVNRSSCISAYDRRMDAAQLDYTVH